MINILKELNTSNSLNHKKEVLEKYKDNELFRKFLYATYSPRVNYYIKKIPEYNTSEFQVLTLEEVLKKLSAITTREITGHKAINYLKGLLEDLGQESVLLEKIIDRDLSCNIGRTLINKVFKGLIEDTPYMGCKPFSRKLVEDLLVDQDVLCEVKADGRYCNVIILDDITLESRQGEITLIKGSKLLSDLEKLPKNIVLNGELVMDLPISRLTSNGYIASIISIQSKGNNPKDIDKLEKESGTEYQALLDSIKLIAWDIIPYESYLDGIDNTPRLTRLDNLIKLIGESTCESIGVVEHIIVRDYQSVMRFFQKCLSRGEEGVVVKSLIGIWKDGKHKWQVKMKVDYTVDLKIVGFNYGSKGTKNESVISSLLCESSCGQLIANAQGIKEKEMQYITDNMNTLLGTIVEVKCNGISENRNGGKSLFYPTFVKFRDDLANANSYEDIVEINNSNL